ncbi:MAG TPA: NUDIX domain-containing protein [Alphaproteobacteria bacterium]|nr:NUDIX domain-containing protein [Alphaproteobacteria bacterium]
MEDFILTNKERMRIFQIMCENKNLKFNKLVELSGIRSNKLSYQLNLMKKKDFVTNNEGGYQLSMKAQTLIPYFSQIFKKEIGVLPVVLGIVKNKDKILLIQRKKMPYKGYFGLFAGKQVSGETIPETMEREIFEEAKIKSKFENCNAVVYERIKENGYFKHSFLLIITTLTTKETNAMEQEEGRVEWFKLKDVMDGKIKNMIPSDLEFIKKYSDKRIEIDNYLIEENGDKLELKK